MKFVYFTDPMCSWCYGFGPEVRRLMAHYSAIPLDIIPGGLRPHEKRPLSANRAKEISFHWDEVHAETGLPFDKTFFERHPGFVYDTYPASRAIVAVRRIAPEKTLAMLSEIQRRFYALGQDTTAIEELVQAAAACGISPDEFQARYLDSATETETAEGFARFQELGGMGFPMLLLNLCTRNRVIAIGYQPFEQLQLVVENVIKKEHGKC